MSPRLLAQGDVFLVGLSGLSKARREQ